MEFGAAIALLLAIAPVIQLIFGLGVARQLRRPLDGEVLTRPPRNPSLADAPSRSAPTVAIIVAARNEVDTIDHCLKALYLQSLPCEVIVVDDGSTDDTKGRAEVWLSAFDGRLSILSGGPGKALALETGLRATDASLILTTDADCRPEPGWAAGMVAALEQGTSLAVGGCTMVRHRDVQSRLEALDWGILLATAAAASERGRLLTAMGNNMGMHRDALESVGGFRSAASSVIEDYYLIRQMDAIPPGASLRMTASLLNWTEPVGSLTGAFRQRRRWALGSLRGVTLNKAIMVGAMISMIAPWVLTGLGLAGLRQGSLPYSGTLDLLLPLGLILLFSRWLVHLGILSGVQRRLTIRLPLVWIPLHDFLMSLYCLLVPISLVFWRSTKWKERVTRDGEVPRGA